MIRTLRLFLLGLLVCSASTNASAQDDLLWKHADGRHGLWEMGGTTTMERGYLVGEGWLPDPLWEVVATHGFMVLFQHRADGRLTGWATSCGMPYSTFSVTPSQVPDPNWKVRGVGYFNNDINFDLVWQNEVTGQVAVWFMSSIYQAGGTTRLDGRLLTPSAVPDTDWRIVGVADFNRDGYSDLLWQHQSSGLIGLWYMRGTTRIDGVLLSPGHVPDTNWKIRAVGLFNDDFYPDLIWQHQTTGQVSAWLMQGHQRVDGVLLSPDHVADTSWRIVGIQYRNYWDCYF